MEPTVFSEEIDVSTLNNNAKQKYLEFLPKNLPPIKWIWEEMDRVWHEQSLNNKVDLTSQNIIKGFGKQNHDSGFFLSPIKKILNLSIQYPTIIFDRA